MRSRNSKLAYCWYICLGCLSFTSCHANGVLSNNLTNLYPFPPIQFFMNALREKGIWVVFMLIGNVTYQWFPLGQYQIICMRVHAFIVSHPFSLLAASIFFTMDFAMCHCSKKCFTAGWDSRIHLATPLWRSEIKMGIVKPETVIRKSKQALQPSNSMALLLPDWLD